MKKFLLVLICLFAVCGVAFAQPTVDDSTTATKVGEMHSTDGSLTWCIILVLIGIIGYVLLTAFSRSEDFAQYKENFKKTKKFLIMGVVGLCVLITVLYSIAKVPASYNGVKLQFGAVTDITMDEGWHFITPFGIDSYVIIYTNTLKEEQVDCQAVSKDLQDVYTNVAVLYHVDSSSVNDLYRNLRLDFNDRVIDPAINESLKATTAHFTASELITERPVVKRQVEERIKGLLEPYGLIVENVLITNFKFSPLYSKAIEQKMVQEQASEEARWALERIKVEADQKVAAAKGEAESTIMVAEAKAKAIQLEASALSANAKLTELRFIEKWDGKLPNVMAGSSNLLMSIMGQ